MDNSGPDYCYRCKVLVSPKCNCSNPIVTHDEWIGILEGILHEITVWYDAYPKAVFVEPTEEQWLEVHHLLNKAGRCSLVAISGSRRKHVLDGIGKIIGKNRTFLESQSNV